MEALVVQIEADLEFAYPKIADSVTWTQKFNGALEALSRLVVRVPAARARAILQRALRYYKDPLVAYNHRTSSGLKNLLVRSWEPIPAAEQDGLVLQIMGLPIGGLDGFDVIWRMARDPVMALRSYRHQGPERTEENDGQWSAVILQILAGLRVAGEARKRAALRYSVLCEWQNLRSKERQELDDALWIAEFITPDGLPGGTDLHDWVFVDRAKDERRANAAASFQAKWFGRQHFKGEEQVNEFLYDLGLQLTALSRGNTPFVPSEAEADQVRAYLKTWAELPNIEDHRLFGGLKRSYGVHGVRSLIRLVKCEPDLASLIFQKASQLNKVDGQTFVLFPPLYDSLPERQAEIETAVRLGLAADNAKVANAAVIALHVWFDLAATNSGSAPPADLLREVGIMIATRKRGVLNQALQLAKAVFDRGSVEQRTLVDAFTRHGLEFLLDELSYDNDDLDVDGDGVPLLRRDAANLAVAMAKSGLSQDPTISRWLKVLGQDPLPEVRNAVFEDTVEN